MNGTRASKAKAAKQKAASKAAKQRQREDTPPPPEESGQREESPVRGRSRERSRRRSRSRTRSYDRDRRTRAPQEAAAAGVQQFALPKEQLQYLADALVKTKQDKQALGAEPKAPGLAIAHRILKDLQSCDSEEDRGERVIRLSFMWIVVLQCMRR
jgi:hypothetical protein